MCLIEYINGVGLEVSLYSVLDPTNGIRVVGLDGLGPTYVDW